MMSSTVSNSISLINRQINTISLALYLRTMYSILIVEVNIVLCFLLLHNTTAPFKNRQYLMTDF